MERYIKFFKEDEEIINGYLTGGDFVNMYTISPGSYWIGVFGIFLIVFIFILLSNSSLSYYIDRERCFASQ